LIFRNVSLSSAAQDAKIDTTNGYRALRSLGWLRNISTPDRRGDHNCGAESSTLGKNRRRSHAALTVETPAWSGWEFFGKLALKNLPYADAQFAH